MEGELKRVYEIGGLPHFHTLEEEVWKSSTEPLRDKPECTNPHVQFNMFKVCLHSCNYITCCNLCVVIYPIMESIFKNNLWHTVILFMSIIFCRQKKWEKNTRKSPDFGLWGNLEKVAVKTRRSILLVQIVSFQHVHIVSIYGLIYPFWKGTLNSYRKPTSPSISVLQYFLPCGALLFFIHVAYIIL